MDSDLALALKLQEEFDEEYSSTQKKKSFLDLNDESGTNMSEIDPSLEYTDPTPDIYRMFVNFDRKFFWSKLGSVRVMWSKRMTTSAGVCRYRTRNGETSISLSLPLLKLRPRKDLVETLLHEMIHAYLFVTKNNKDRDGHGPEFQSHMHRINKSAGTNITIYHSFHAEVNLYKTHWWRCNGPCQSQQPFYGFVKRASNRAPGPNDFWFADHQRNCGGEFIKVKEPENYKNKKKQPETGNQGNSPSKIRTLQDYFKKTNNTKPVANSATWKETDPNKFSASSSKKAGTFTSMKSGTFTLTKPGSVAKAGPNYATKADTSSATKAGTSTAIIAGRSSATKTGRSSATKADTSSATKAGTSTAIIAGRSSATVTGTSSATKTGTSSATKTGTSSATKAGTSTAIIAGTSSATVTGKTSATKAGTSTAIIAGTSSATVTGTSSATKADSSSTLISGRSSTINAGASTRGITTFSGLSDKEDTKDSQGSSLSNQNIVPFSGKGYTLGKASVPISDKPWLKRFNTVVPSQSATKRPSPSKQSSSSTSTATTTSTTENSSKKMKVDDSNGKFKENTVCTVACPVCGDSINALEVNDHLDLCLTKISLQEDMLDDDRCIACDQPLGRKCDVPTLCVICEQGACNFDFNSPDMKSDDCSISCPMCEKKMSSGDLERHLEICIIAEDEDNQTPICDEDDENVIVLN